MKTIRTTVLKIILYTILTLFNVKITKADLQTNLAKIINSLDEETLILNSNLPIKNVTNPKNTNPWFRSKNYQLPDLVGLDLGNFLYGCHCRNFGRSDLIEEGPNVATKGQFLGDRIVFFL